MPVPSLVLLVLTYLGFISLGLPDAIHGVTWPSVSGYFNVPLGNLGILLVATSSGYFISSVSVGRLLQKIGVGDLLAGSCLLVVFSLSGFALAWSWPIFVASGVIAGLGAGAIDTALNVYASRHFSARQMSWLHACWGVGATLGASIAASVLAKGSSWVWAYGVVAWIMAPLTLIFALSRRKWGGGESVAQVVTEGNSLSGKDVSFADALRHPVTWLHALVFFFYIGLESSLSNWSFTLLTQYRDVDKAAAGTAVTLYWASLTGGRFLLGSIADRVGIHRLVFVATTTALIGGFTFILAPWREVSMMGLVVLGASIAPIYPGMMSLTPMRLGRFADIAVGLQVAAAVLGQVTVPSFGGLLLKSVGLRYLNGMIGVLLVLLWLVIMSLYQRDRRLGIGFEVLRG